MNPDDPGLDTRRTSPSGSSPGARVTSGTCAAPCGEARARAKAAAPHALMNAALLVIDIRCYGQGEYSQSLLHEGRVQGS
jgi:hypothetical protein